MVVFWGFACLFSAVAVLGELCEFPADNPIRDLEDGETIQTQIFGNSRVYIYTDKFGNCHGCVVSVKFCYRPGSIESEDLMTVEIRNGGHRPTDSYTVIVNTTRDRANCPERYNLGFSQCCVEQPLTESFAVTNPQWYYALRLFNPSSSLLYHLNEAVNGRQEDLNGVPIEYPPERPLFYFNIDKSDVDCSKIKQGSETNTKDPITNETNEEQDTSEQQDSSQQVVYISVGVSGLVVLLIAVALVLISVTVCLRQRYKKKKLLTTASNVAYNTSSGGLSLISAQEYDYVSTNTPHTSENVAYGIDVEFSGVAQNEVELKDNEAYGGVAENEVELKENEAYGGVAQNEVELKDNEAYGGVTQNEVELKENEAYISTATGGVGEEYDYVRTAS